jgi:hypothetical protein
MGDFWFKMKRGVLARVNYEGHENIQDLYTRVATGLRSVVDSFVLCRKYGRVCITIFLMDSKALSRH